MVDQLIANVLSYSIGILHNYLLTRLWVYPETKNQQSAVQLLQFCLISLVGLALNNLLVWFLEPLFGQFVGDYSYLPAKFVATAFVLIWNFGLIVCGRLAESSLNKRGNSMRILVVEDTHSIAQFISQGLSEADFGVDVARNGNEGFDYALSAEYDLFILNDTSCHILRYSEIGNPSYIGLVGISN